VIAATGPQTRSVIVLLALVAFGSAMSLRVMDAALPRLSSDFGIGIAEASHVITVFSIAYGCLQIVFGPAGDRFGKLRVILFACVAGIAVSVACALAPTFDLLVFTRALAGAAMASMMPLSMAWIGDNVPYEQRQPVLARFLAGQITGLAMGQAIGGIATDLVSWRLPFWLLAGWFLLITALFVRVTDRASRNRVERDASTPHPGLVAQCRSVLVVPWARRVLALVFIEGAALYGPFAFFATHLHHKHGLSLALAGSMVVAFAIGGLSFTVIAGRLVARLGESGLARGGALLMAVGIALLALVPGDVTSLVVLPGLFAAGLGFYMLHNTLQINATQMAPHARGTAVALFASCFFLGQSVGVALAGALVERLTTTPVLLCGAALLLVVGFVFGAMRAARTAR